MSHSELVAKAERLRALHESETILRVVNVWDPITAKVIAALPGTTALATAGHSIAVSHGYADGKIPLEIAIAALGRICAATDLPVSADLDAGFGDPGATTKLAIAAGAVGGNVEDRLQPLAESVAAVEAVVAAAEFEGIRFQLNARTDALVLAGDRPVSESIKDAVRRGRAYLEAGASLVFVPGVLTRAMTEELVDGLGVNRVSVIGLPGSLSAAEYEALGVARISYGPLTQRHALRALRDLAIDLYDDGVIPLDTPELN